MIQNTFKFILSFSYFDMKQHIQFLLQIIFHIRSYTCGYMSLNADADADRVALRALGDKSNVLIPRKAIYIYMNVYEFDRSQVLAQAIA